MILKTNWVRIGYWKIFWVWVGYRVPVGHCQPGTQEPQGRAQRVPDTRPEPEVFFNTRSVPDLFSKSSGISGIGYFRKLCLKWKTALRSYKIFTYIKKCHSCYYLILCNILPVSDTVLLCSCTDKMKTSKSGQAYGLYHVS